MLLDAQLTKLNNNNLNIVAHFLISAANLLYLIRNNALESAPKQNQIT